MGHDPEQPGTCSPDSDPSERFPERSRASRSSLTGGGRRDDPVAQVSLRTLAIVCQVATHQDAEAGRTFASLVALVERQPADFHLVWDWTDLRDHLANSKAPPLPARREPLRSSSTLSAATTRPRSWPGSRRSRTRSRPGPRNPKFQFTTAAPGPR